MPNGIDRGWYRLCASVNGFRSRYNRWPTKMHLFEGTVEWLFSPESLKKLHEKLELIHDGSPFIAEDDQGNQFNYGKEEYPIEEPDINAREWLGISPDSEEFLSHDHGITITPPTE